MDGCGSCSCLSPHPLFPPSSIPTPSAISLGIVSFLHSRSRQSGHSLICRIYSHSSFLSFWCGFLFVEGWISLFANLKSAACQRPVVCALGAQRSLFFLLASPSHACDSFCILNFVPGHSFCFSTCPRCARLMAPCLSTPHLTECYSAIPGRKTFVRLLTVHE